MNSISISIHFCGMCDRDYSERIKISMPYNSVRWYYDLDECDLPKSIDSVSHFIEWFKENKNDYLKNIDSSCKEKLALGNIYLENEGYLLAFKYDKPLLDLFDLLSTDYLQFHCFCVNGGISQYYNGYRFAVYSDENIHRFDKPHVHVIYNGISPRYDLETLEMFPKDEHCREHCRDKKMIKEYLEENREFFLNQWRLNVNGLISPKLTSEKKQYLKES